MKFITIVLGFIILALINPLGATHEKIKTYRPRRANMGIERGIKLTSKTSPLITPNNPTIAVSTPTPAQPTAQLTPAPSAPAAVPTPSVGCSSYLSLVQQYSWPVTTMMAIMQAESSCNPNAYNPSGCYGLFQLMGEDITDPAANIAAAYQKYLDQGLSAWSSYTSGAYEAFL